MKIKSFDIFDTCLIRTCGEPVNLFDTLACNVLGDEADSNLIYDYANIRINAERKALHLAKGNEITIQDIYENADFSGLTNLSKETLIKKELDTEFDSLISVIEIKDLITKYREEGNQIIFISDMYLPSSFIKNVLIKEKIFKDGDLIYVSCEYNANKRTGRLYDLIRKELNISFKDWTHFGDNSISDVRIPRNKGIKTKKINNGYSFYQSVIKDKYPIYVGRLASKIAGLNRAVYLNGIKDLSRLFAIDLISLVYVPFVFNILKTSKEKGINQLFFIARDGGILYEIAKLLSPYFPNISLKYLFLSRSSLYFPAIEKYEDLYKIIDFKRVESIDPLKIIKNYTGVDLSDINVSENKTINEIINDDNVKKIILNAHSQQHQLILDYFKQEGLANHKGIKGAIVDVRGTRKSHQKINSILKKNGYNPIDGFYFEVVYDRINPSLNEHYYSVIHQERISESNKGLSACYSVIESYFSAVNHGRTIGYKRDGDLIKPIFEEDVQSPLHSKIYNTNLKVMRKWTNYYLKNKYYKNNQFISTLGIFVYQNFLRNPNYRYILPLKDLIVSSSGIEQITLIKKLSFKEVLRRKPDSDLTWYSASLIYTFRGFATYVKGLENVLSKIKKLVKLYK